MAAYRAEFAVGSFSGTGEAVVFGAEKKCAAVTSDHSSTFVNAPSIVIGKSLIPLFCAELVAESAKIAVAAITPARIGFGGFMVIKY